LENVGLNLCQEHKQATNKGKIEDLPATGMSELDRYCWSSRPARVKA